jgi:ubiquinone/menaquinone biosynthesis C-methylase UbiE
VLDLACGPGILSHALAQAGAEILGIDATAAMLERARERCSEEDSASFREASAYDLPFGDEHFAGAVTRLSIHHFAEPGRALTELRRVGATAGIDLRLEGNTRSFTHQWCFIQARAT